MKTFVLAAGIALSLLICPTQSQQPSAGSSSTLPIARWGSASTLYNSHFIIQGGKVNGNGETPGGGGYTYTSGPNTNTTYSLDLSQSFQTTSPPWETVQLASSSQGYSPSTSFHSLTALNDGTFLVFGGMPDPSANIQSGNDSAYTFTLSSGGQHASWSDAVSSWGQPERRMHHSAAGNGNGGAYIIGGQSTSGSFAPYDQLWTINSASSNPTFQQNSASNTPPAGVIDGTATYLSDGTIILLGGIDTNNTLQTFQTIASYSPSTQKWRLIATQGMNNSAQGYPSPRRGHVAVALPDQKIFIHGGASLELDQAMSDAWILDWSQNPPMWSSVQMSNGQAPSARFAHSAVAYGAKVALIFGWASNNPADANLYVFDATSIQNTNEGWTGGQWSTSYTPDPNVGKNSNDGSADGSSNGQNEKGGPSSSDSGSTKTKSKDPFSPTSTGSNSSSSDDGSTSAGTKAGAVLGSLVGLGLVAGVGLFAYRKHQHSQMNNWRKGEGDAVLLGGSGHYDGPDELYTLEKGLAEGGGGANSFYQPGMHPIGPREPSRPNLSSSPWTMGNIGHAMEGSGPHLRERLALLTGLTAWGGSGNGQYGHSNQRFDMLAGEVDDERGEAGETYAMQHRNGDHLEEEDEDGYDRDDNDMDRHIRERSYGRVDQEDWDEMAAYETYGDLGKGGGGRGQIDTFVQSPFEDDRKDRKNSAGPGGAAAIYSGEYFTNDKNSIMEDANSVSDVAMASGNSSQSHDNKSTSNKSAASRSSQSIVQSNQLSFSDSIPHRKRGSGMMPSPMIRRSPTWWDRFMGQSFLERSASGRLLPGPRADEPIRDPTEPPTLGAIREASHGTYASNVSDPFHDDKRDTVIENLQDVDEHGRMIENGEGHYPAKYTNQSLTSLQSARTADTTMLEARMRTMDVQRAGTISSRRTYSTSGRSDRIGSTGGSMSSAGGLSRNTSTRHGFPQRPQQEQIQEDDANIGQTPLSESTPGSVVWDPRQWESENMNVPRTVYEQDEADESRDIADTTREHEDEGMTFKNSVVHPKIRLPSEAPSITPSTTKRARQNPELTSPVSPPQKRARSPPLRGTVKDRAKAIERKWTQEGPNAVLPVPRSPAISINSQQSGGSGNSNQRIEEEENALSPDTFIPGRGGRPILTKLTSPSKSANKNLLNENDEDLVMSPEDMVSNESHSKKQQNEGKRFTHDLVPKAQLYIANPDKRQGSQTTTNSSTHS